MQVVAGEAEERVLRRRSQEGPLRQLIRGRLLQDKRWTPGVR